MRSRHADGRTDRTNIAHWAAIKLRDTDDSVHLKGRKAIRPFRHPLYEEPMFNKLRLRVEAIVGCSVHVEAHYNKRNKLVSLTVSKLNNSIPA